MMHWQDRISSYKGRFSLHIKVGQSAILQRKGKKGKNSSVKTKKPNATQSNEGFHVPVEPSFQWADMEVSKNNSLYVR